VKRAETEVEGAGEEQKLKEKRDRKTGKKARNKKKKSFKTQW